MTWDIRLGKGASAFSFPGGCTSLYIPVHSLPATPFRLALEFLQEEVMSRDLLSSGCPGPLSLRSMSLQGLTEQPFPRWAAELAGPRTLEKRAQCGNVRDMRVG